ncbi:sporulation integral membrane protein YlbJ [Aureibacillus halotolerans]|uniref:Sporulation integral membrane protein YlbJ n=1 Tax=Aureibacillus halotolerans TaxID=1508390 RepID=A0A4R6U715_9BACI|nr:sporulation integral membrane protein YlbJ [Aureibacillus halotolerans]TDQ42308.1 sporulation integral membrane protein YlbJ [Aureibacillus halotolerans]
MGQYTKTYTVVLSLCALLLTAALITFPQDAVGASVKGLTMWWTIVFPSLLPFFILSEIMVAIGIVTFFSVLFEPFMRPLFKVPGSGGVVWSMSMASGFPAGARMTTQLRKQNAITQAEAERLVAFTNASNPLFIFGAVAVGFFHDAHLGYLLAAAHYGGNLFVGLAMRFHRRSEAATAPFRWPSLRNAFRTLHEHRLKHHKPIGALLGEAVRSSVQTLLLIGGFIILFSVLNQLLSSLSIAALFQDVVAIIFSILHLPAELSGSFVGGFFEITLGAQLASETTAPIVFQAVIVSFVLAFSGLSVHAQVASIIAETDIRYAPFFRARCLHGLFSAVLALLLFPYLYTAPSMQTSGEVGETSQAVTFFGELLNGMHTFGPVITLGGLALYCVCYASDKVFTSK